MVIVQNKPFYSVKQIIQDNWDNYVKNNKLREIEREEVKKMLSCKSISRGCFVYFCMNCMKHVLVTFGCNSRLCSCCGKRYADAWANKLIKKIIPKIEHRHMVFSVPDILWCMIRKNRSLQKVLMDVSARTIKKCFKKTLKQKLKIGIICVLHPFGRDLVFKPHVHCIVTNGGFTLDNNFLKLRYINYNLLHKTWQRELLEELKKYLSKKIINYCFTKYQKGFAAYIKPEIIWSGKHLVKYIGRYLRHPAIANSRIIFYDGKIVKFYFKDHKTKKKVFCEMSVEEFISAVIQHIPEKNFKMIRYYDFYSRKGKERFKIVCKQSSLKQEMLFNLTVKEVYRCSSCGNKMKFIGYFPKPPDDFEKRFLYDVLIS